MDKIKPIILAVAGPNGSGKTTLTKKLPTIGTYVNADDMKKEYGLSDLEAAQQAESLRNTLLEKKAVFTFETVLSTQRNLLLLEKAKARGYEVQCVYVLTCDENINVARVKSRLAAGGHDVSEDKIRSRYHRALALVPRLFDICDTLFIYDNTDVPTLVVCKDGIRTDIYPNSFWSDQRLRELIR